VELFGRAVGPKIPTKAADHNKRDKKDSYINKKGEMAGIIKLVSGWHGIGHKVGSLR
jgi:hypothetical protein